MKKLLLALAVFFISSPTYADRIQGHFFCEEKFPDGSSAKFTLKVNGDRMTTKQYHDLTDDYVSSEYEEVYHSDLSFDSYTIYAGSLQTIYVLSTIENKNKISTTYITTFFNTVDENEIMVAHGLCDKI